MKVQCHPCSFVWLASINYLNRTPLENTATHWKPINKHKDQSISPTNLVQHLEWHFHHGWISIDGPLELNDCKFSMVETILQEVSPIHCANASHLGPFRSGKGPRETERPINLVLQSHSIKDSMSLVLVVRRKGSPQGWLHGVVWCYLIPDTPWDMSDSRGGARVPHTGRHQAY